MKDYQLVYDKWITLGYKLGIPIDDSCTDNYGQLIVYSGLIWDEKLDILRELDDSDTLE